MDQQSSPAKPTVVEVTIEGDWMHVAPTSGPYKGIVLDKFRIGNRDQDTPIALPGLEDLAAARPDLSSPPG